MNWVSEKIIKIGNLHNQKITRTLKPELWNHYRECLEREREREREREMIDLKIVMEDFDKYPVQELRERERERDSIQFKE